MVSHQQQGLQVPERLIGAPVFGKFHGGSSQVPVILLKLGLKAAEQRKRIGSRSRKSGQDLVLVQTAYLSGRVLDDAFAQRNLSVSSHDNFAVLANGQDGGGADFREMTVGYCPQ